jgi:hypothetical protein
MCSFVVGEVNEDLELRYICANFVEDNADGEGSGRLVKLQNTNVLLPPP